MHGAVSFCRDCASKRPEECLSRMRGRKRGKMPVLAMVIVFLGIVAGAAVWIVKKPEAPKTASETAQRDLPKHDGAATPAPAQPLASAMNLLHDAAQHIQAATHSQALNTVHDVGMIHLLYVTGAGTDAASGLASRLYITTEAPEDVPAKLVTKVGDQMEASFEEGLRYVRKLPREWEKDMAIRLSFEDRYTPKDGGSAGTGFTVAMLAAIRKISLDPELAITGDLTIDGEVQPVGGVVEKLRGAIAAKCKITLIPKRNAHDAIDLAILDTSSQLWETQIFSINSVEEAVGLARKDREENFAEAISRFERLRARLPKVVTANYLQSPIVQSELKEILRLAPTHLSAETLLSVVEGHLPKTLSLNRSVNEILSASYLFVAPVLGSERRSHAKSDKTKDDEDEPESDNKNRITIFPEREYAHIVSRFEALAPIVDPRAVELKAACGQYMAALRSELLYKPPTGPDRIYTYDQMAHWNMIAKNENAVVKDIEEACSTSRSRLLLVIRKLNTDGSLLSEISRK